MQDAPDPDQLLAAVVRYLRDDAGPALARAGGGALAYQARVAANMLDIVRRQQRLDPAAASEERVRLRHLLGAGVDGVDGDGGPAELARLNQRLADRIASGEIDLASPGLADHLWRTTLAKLAVDQPTYETYRRHLAACPEFGEPTNPANPAHPV